MLKLVNVNGTSSYGKSGASITKLAIGLSHKITEWLVARNYEGWIICEDEAHVAVEDPDGVTIQNGQWCKDNLLPLVS